MREPTIIRALPVAYGGILANIGAKKERDEKPN